MDADSFYGRTRISHHRFLQDAVSEIQEHVGSADIVITGPPEGGCDSDLEIEDDNNMEENTIMPNEIAGEVDVFLEEEDEEEYQERPNSKKRKINLPKWKKTHLSSDLQLNTERQEDPSKELLERFPHLANFDEFGLYNEIFGDVIDLLVSETNRYANREKNDPSFSMNKEEFCHFFGLILLSGYNIRKSERDYWSKSSDLECKAFIETMSRNRFQEIKTNLHAADNQNLGDSKMAKVQPLYDLINQKMTQFGILHEKLSIDESMVPYFGRHSCKQFIRAKPIRFGYKLWVICSSDGLPYQVKIYEGKTADNEEGPLGSRVVKNLLKICDKPEKHHIFVDNFFSSYDLFVDLKEQKFKATGTVRENRLKKCNIMDSKTMKKKERGTFDFRSDGNIEVVKWHDNAVVTLCSNVVGVNPLGRVKRRVKGKGEQQVTQPYVVKLYNNGMGGVDLMDRALSDFRPKILGKKWYWTLLINALNISVVYTWRLCMLLKGEKIPQKEFRRNVVYCLRKKTIPSAYNRSGPSRGVLDSVRRDGSGHYPKSITSRKCVVCKKSTKIQCEKCEKSLHLLLCFQYFHE